MGSPSEPTTYPAHFRWVLSSEKGLIHYLSGACSVGLLRVGEGVPHAGRGSTTRREGGPPRVGREGVYHAEGYFGVPLGTTHKDNAAPPP